jgi:hypothetical protein
MKLLRKIDNFLNEKKEKALTAKERKMINNVIGNAAKGFFNDDVWKGKDIVFKKLTDLCDKNGWDWEQTEAKYEKENGTPVRKRWTVKITVGEKVGYVTIIAAGAGSVSDPLDKYDIVAYI